MEHVISVKTKSKYDVVIGEELLTRCGTFLSPLGCRQAVVITDSHVAPLYLEAVQSSLQKAGIASKAFVFPAGEENKNMGTLSQALEFLGEMQLPRDGFVIALGGGVVGDLAGFASSVYLRGVRYVQLPTTLLAAVDSSVGGKTAVDLKAGKNLAGAFRQPAIVLCDMAALSTLPPREWENGMAEAIKYGVLFDEKLFSGMQGPLEGESLCSMIAACVAWKAKIVAEDELDRGNRRLLNLGHTMAHAIEKCSGYSVSHGQAVAAGLAMIARAGESLGITAPGTAKRIENVLQQWHLPTDSGYPAEKLAEAIANDKKREDQTVFWIIPEKIGACRIVPMPWEKTEEIISLSRKG